MMKTYQGTRRLYDSSQQKITAISKALCGVTEGLSILLLFFFFSCRRAPLDDYKPTLVNVRLVLKIICTWYCMRR
jgi:hypothetical protein